MKKSQTKALAEYIVEAKFDDFPGEVIQKAKRCVLDSIACALGGCTSNAGKIVMDLVRHLGGGPESTLIGNGFKVACTYAAFANSYANNALDFDDTLKDPLGHLGCTVVPTAIAVGESRNVSGKDLITSIILGYEVSSRIGSAIWPSKKRFERVWPFSYQVFGSVTSASKLLSLDTDEILNAFGIAGAAAPVPNTL